MADTVKILIKEFYSYCGGLPAPECANNPLGFKFSWSPKGAILSQCNSASFLKDGQQVDIPSAELMSTAKPHHVAEGYSFVAYPNRNSVPFRDFCGIPEADTVIRGSLRYEGNPRVCPRACRAGWVEPERRDWLKKDGGIMWGKIQTLVDRIKEVYKFPNEKEADRIISGMDEFRLFSDTAATIKGGNVFDTFCHRLAQLLSFKPGERDLVMLQHKFVVEWSDGKKDTMTSTLELLGDPNRFSAMALSVGATCGVATQPLLDGHPAFTKPGIYSPYTREMCDPIREGVC
ncbi:hypothetical protein GE09DRAFT_1167427 [Coniochaeta sp. 2T2.1]|nr:hypothetical protein GE09DRAFT_1167427 [Coniochaeta sp. 2T2.1]